MYLDLPLHLIKLVYHLMLTMRRQLFYNFRNIRRRRSPQNRCLSIRYEYGIRKIALYRSYMGPSIKISTMLVYKLENYTCILLPLVYPFYIHYLMGLWLSQETLFALDFSIKFRCRLVLLRMFYLNLTSCR